MDATTIIHHVLSWLHSTGLSPGESLSENSFFLGFNLSIKLNLFFEQVIIETIFEESNRFFFR